MIAQATGAGTGAGSVDGPRTPVGSTMVDGRELRQRATKQAVEAAEADAKAKADKEVHSTSVHPCSFRPVDAQSSNQAIKGVCNLHLSGGRYLSNVVAFWPELLFSGVV